MTTQELAELVEYSEARAYASLLRAAPESFLERHGLRVVSIAGATAVVAPPVTNSLNMNRVIGLGLAEPAADLAVEQIVEVYADRGLSFGVEIGPFARPRDIRESLRKRRMRPSIPTAMHYRLARAREPGSGDVCVKRAPASASAAVADICCQIFRMPPVAHALIAGTADTPGWRQWLAYIDGRAIGAALSYIDQGIAWLGWDATLPEYRGRGAQAALIAARLDDAGREGCTYATSETAVSFRGAPDPSYRNYERLGFSVAYERDTYVCLSRFARGGLGETRTQQAVS